MSDSVFPITITVPAEAAGQRLDQFLAAQLPDTSRARVQLLLEEEKALVNGKPSKPSLKLKGGETITILGDPTPPPLRAMAEDIPLDIIYEDDDLAVINKPAGMMVHAGAGATDDDRNRGTLVNALLHRFAQLSEVGGETRPGIVHRLDKETSGLILVARNDVAHRNLAKQFSGREVKKRYVALVHGWPERPRGTISAEISRDAIRRIRMTTRGSGGRTAVTHYEVRERIDSPYGKFALVDVRIETGRTHQIRVHMASIGHPVVGDTLYGAAGVLRSSAAPRKGSRKRSRRRTRGEMPSRPRLSREHCASIATSCMPPRSSCRIRAPASRYRLLLRFLRNSPASWRSCAARNSYNENLHARSLHSSSDRFTHLRLRCPGRHAAASAVRTVGHEVSAEAGCAAGERRSGTNASSGTNRRARDVCRPAPSGNASAAPQTPPPAPADTQAKPRFESGYAGQRRPGGE